MIAITTEAPTLTRDEYIADVLARFAENPENRDRALAMCLWHLERLAMIGAALEGVMPQVGALASNPMIRRLIRDNGP